MEPGLGLNIERDVVLLSWPASAGAVVLEGTDDMAPSKTWREVPFTSCVIGEWEQVIVRPRESLRFYRLRKR